MMMKKTMITFSTFLMVGIIVGTIGTTAHAETWRQKMDRMNEEYNQKLLDELEAAGNLTQDAIDALDGPNSTRKPNHKSRSSESNTQSGGSGTTQGKGWVYSSDELHVIGLPEGSNGYTKPGYYGDVDQSYSSGYSGEGKGWVYDADELHVIGLPEGEDGYTMPGYYGDID